MLQRMTYGRFVPVALLLVISATALGDQVTPQQIKMAKRAAEVDAYRKLAQEILGMNFAGETTVGDFYTESDRMTRALDDYIKGIRLNESAARVYDDGTCMIPAEVTIEEVVKILKKVYDEYYDGERRHTSNFEELRREARRKVIRVEGWGAALTTTLMPDPASLPYVRPVVKDGAELKLPEIYRKFPGVKRLRAKEIATMDAQRKLLERVYGLHIKSDTTVRDFIKGRDETRVRAQHRLVGAKIDSVRYQANGLVQVQMSITLDHVIKTLKKTYDESYDGKNWTRESFEEIRKYTDRQTITVVGEGPLDVGLRQPDSPSAKRDDEIKRRIHRESEEIISEETVIVFE